MFKKIPAESLRSEVDPARDKALWRPTWKCYCCHDTGFILPRLAELVLEGYQTGKSKIPVCNASKCSVGIGSNLRLLESVDRRVSSSDCDQLDRMERQDWNDYVLRQADLIKENKDKVKSLTDKLAQNSSLRKSHRTSDESMLSQQKHQNVLAE